MFLETFSEYQLFTMQKAVYNTDCYLLTGKLTEFGAEESIKMEYMYPALALAEEAGEVAGKVAKFIRKSRDDVNVPKLRNDIAKELGDCLFQVSECARMFGYSLQEIAELNEDKLNDRQERGVLVGEGDNR
jgi:NTP pyrophosphatase (non-canonical NTP hydrolase)